MSSEVHAATARENGKAGGAPIGTQRCDKFTYDPERLAETAAAAILAGRAMPPRIPGIPPNPVSDKDREAITRMTAGQMTAEQFSLRVAARLRDLADKTADRIHEKLETDAYKPEGLSYLFGVLLDKLARYEGRIGTQTVNQINVFESVTREQLLRSLTENVTVNVTKLGHVSESVTPPRNVSRETRDAAA